MATSMLPPGPDLRIWNGRGIRVTSMYSVAGISTSFILDGEGGRILMEAGDGCTRDIIEIQRYCGDHLYIGNMNPADLLRAVIISHPHYDHYSGLLNLLNFLHLMNRRSVLRIIYPFGGKAIEGIVDHFRETLWEDCPFEIELIPVEGRSAMEVEDFMVETIPVGHRNSKPGAVGEVIPAMAYSISSGDERVAYTGDTGGAPGLEDMINGADLGIIEATFAETPRGHEEVHLDIEKARKLSRLAKDHWLTHFTAGSFHLLNSEK